MSTIGIIHSGSNNKHHDNQITALRDVLLRAGVPKKDILDPRWADDDPKTLHDHADDSIDPKKDNVDVLVAGAVARLVGIEGGVVSGVINLESSGVRASDWRPRHDKRYHEA